MNRYRRVLGLALMLSVGTIAPASPQTLKPLTIAGLRTIQFLPVQYAHEKGYFKNEGLDVTMLVLNAGPPVISAIVNGSAQVGYASPVAIIFARSQQQPIRMFEALTLTNSSNRFQWNSLLGSERSGIKSMKDLKGKTIALNTMGGACELQFRAHMDAAGVPFDAVKKIVLPFPQMPAALQLGNADAGCAVEPFRTSMRVSPDIKAVTLASGTLAGSRENYPEDVLFVREDWGKAHADELQRLNRAIAQAVTDLKSDPARLTKTMIQELKIDAEIANQIDVNPDFANVPVTAAYAKPLIDSLKTYGMLKSDISADDVVMTGP